MGFWQRLGNAILPPEERSIERPSVSITGATLEDLFGEGAGTQTKAGAKVNPVSALRNATVWACVRVLSETIATLPLKVYKRGDSGHEVAREHPLYRVLHDSPNETLTAFVYRETGMAHALLYSGWVSLILGEGDGTRLLLVMPDRVRREVTVRGLRYFLRMDEHTETEFPASQVIDIHGLSLDGICGLSTAHEMREAIGLALAAEEHASRYFSNGTRLSGILSTEEVLKDDVIERVRRQWQSNQAGLANAYKTAVLEQGLKFQAISQTAEQAQLKDVRQQQIEEVARAFRVPPMFVGDYSRMTYANAEHNDLHFAKHTIAPWCRRIEQELNRKLFANDPDHFCEFDMDGLLRGDFKTRIDGFARGIQGGIYTPNEARQRLNLPPKEGGDQLYIQQNMASVTAIQEGQEETPDENGAPGVRPGPDG